MRKITPEMDAHTTDELSERRRDMIRAASGLYRITEAIHDLLSDDRVTDSTAMLLIAAILSQIEEVQKLRVALCWPKHNDGQINLPLAPDGD